MRKPPVYVEVEREEKVKRNIAVLTDKSFDLIVIGAGIFGSCTAWDAALRGLSVALVEKKDFSHATSANHFKVVHGGIRYLQHGDVVRIRESSRERSALLRIAPHMAKPLPIVIPTYGHGLRGKELLSVGMLLYDLLTWDRNRGLQYEQRVPRGSFISRQKICEMFPGLDKKGLTGGAVFYDGQMCNPPRLALAFLRSAVEKGAEVANYVEAQDFIWEGNRVTGVVARDQLSGDTLQIRGKMVVNAAGPWAAHLLDNKKELRRNVEPVFSRDLSFIVRKTIDPSYGLAVPTGVKDADAVLDRGGRHLFFVPWHEYTLVGVWHKIVPAPPENITVSAEELRNFTEEVNNCYPALNISPDDIVRVNTGLTLYGEEEKQGEVTMSFGKRSILVDHEREHNIPGMITLIGVRATTARGMAEKTIDLVVKKFHGRHIPCRTETTPIFGGETTNLPGLIAEAVQTRPPGMDPEQMELLVGNYGTHYQDVLKTAADKPELLQTFRGSHVIRAEVLHAIRHEMAVHLGDIVFRRTDLGTAAVPDMDVLRECAQLMAAELGWSEERMKGEINDVKTALPQFS